MDLWHHINGSIELEVVSADLPALLGKLDRSGIGVYQLTSSDQLTARLTLLRKDLPAAERIIETSGGRRKTLRYKGLYWKLSALRRRKLLVTGLCLLFALQCFIQTRVLFIRVEGSGTVPASLVLEKAEQCGIVFGASRGRIRSEKMKNALLQALPQLQWAGINTYGCTAVISVRPRNQQPQTPQDHGISCMVAGRDGVILSCNATAGTLLCRVGQSVKAGDKLISGYTDRGLSLRAGPARGEVYARTMREITAVAPEKFETQGAILKKVRRYSLIIGKKRINFYKDSRISPTTCDKMYTQKNLTLPGGFVLPVTLVEETIVYYETATFTLSAQQLQQQLLDFAKAYLPTQMVAGSIESYEYRFQNAAPAQLDFHSSCTEMIGKIQKEEIFTPDGKYD